MSANLHGVKGGLSCDPRSGLNRILLSPLSKGRGPGPSKSAFEKDNREHLRGSALCQAFSVRNAVEIGSSGSLSSFPLVVLVLIAMRSSEPSSLSFCLFS